MQLTTEQAAARVQVSDQTIRNYINRGLLPAIKQRFGLDWRYLIELSDLEAFAKRNEITLQEPTK